MQMKKNALLCLIVALCGILTTACIDDSYVPGPGGSSTTDGSSPARAERKEGRIALGYCTYYGSQTPDASVLTHINYAFAELYVRDGQYQSFKLQGTEKRFQQIVYKDNLNNFLDMWDRDYTLINRANSALANMDNVKNWSSESEKNRLLGETYFLSAIGHAVPPEMGKCLYICRL